MVTCAGLPPGVRAGLGALVHDGVPGAVLFVRHGPESYAIAAGVSDTADRTPMRTGDTFRIGSITKSYTAALVMRLVAQGRIALDDPVSRYLPGLVPNGGHISIGELLLHTNGLYNYTGDPAFVAPYLAGDLHDSWRPRELVGLATAHAPLFPPGARYSYSNTNFVLLGLVLEQVTGATYGRQLRDHILRPLGLGSTSLPTDNGSPRVRARRQLPGLPRPCGWERRRRTAGRAARERGPDDVERRRGSEDVAALRRRLLRPDD